MSPSRKEAVPDAEAFPEGWALGIESWSFHRQFYARVGRTCAQGEYTAICTQIRYHRAPRLDRYHYRVTLLDGSSLIVDGGRQYLDGVEPADWTPSQPKPQARGPSIARPLPQQPMRASTLTLKSPAAARLVAERLRKAGVSPLP